MVINSDLEGIPTHQSLYDVSFVIVPYAKLVRVQSVIGRCFKINT